MVDSHPSDRSSRPRVLGEGKWLRLVDLDTWEFAERLHVRDIAVIVAVTPAGRLLLVEQARPSVGGAVIELPAGLVGDEAAHAGEAIEAGARRELEEETGWRAGRMRRLVTGPTSPGVSSEVVTMLWAEGLERVGTGGGVAGERIVVHEIEVERVEGWIAERAAAGTLVDPKVFVGLYFAHFPPRDGARGGATVAPDGTAPRDPSASNS